MQVGTKNRLLEFLSLWRKRPVYEKICLIQEKKKKNGGLKSTLVEDKLNNKLLEIHKLEIFNKALESPNSLLEFILETLRKDQKKSKCLKQLMLIV